MANNSDDFSADDEFKVDESADTQDSKQSPLGNDLTARQPEAANQEDDDGTRSFESTSIELGTTIGPFKLLEELGEGGMGTVFLAEQKKPVKRRVALKIIKAGMDTKQVIARFEAERQALAMMSHVNIAKVFDAGTTKAGRPYFVMELVQGSPITKFCDERKLGIPERLGLFQQVCNAVHHAHQKGVIHRDLKPSNILVTTQDDQPIPKVIDFGLAKATNQLLTEKTMFTAHGQVLGTPQYMSPEQARLNDQDVDTRSDIYSLGIILYELLTGSTPLKRESLRKAAFNEILKRIREEEPERPSSRISNSDDSLDSISSYRQVEPRKFSSLMRGELDWVVLKAIEKDRTRRYEAANNLAADIGHFLNNEPVEARPPSVGYKLSKLVAKNKGLVAATAAIFAALIAGIAATSWFARDAYIAREIAERKTNRVIEEQKETEKQKAIAVAAADSAKRSEQLSKKLRIEAEKATESAGWQVYANKIELAYKNWQLKNRLEAIRILGSCQLKYRGLEHDYLTTMFAKPMTTIGDEHSEASRRVPLNMSPMMSKGCSVSPDGSRCATCYLNDHIKVWNLNDESLFQTIELPKNEQNQTSSAIVRDLDFSSDNILVAAAFQDGMVRIWNVETGKEVTGFRAHPTTTTVSFSPIANELVTGGEDCQVKRWSTSGKLIKSMKGHENYIVDVKYSRDGKTVFSGSADNHIRIWDAESGANTAAIPGFTGNHVAVSPDGKLVAGGSLASPTATSVWNTSTLELVCRTQGHSHYPHHTEFLNNKVLVTGSVNLDIRFWATDSGDEISNISFPSHLISFQLDLDRSFIASLLADGTIRKWSLNRKDDIEVAMPSKPLAVFDGVNSMTFLRGTELFGVDYGTGETIFRKPIGEFEKYVVDKSGDALITLSDGRVVRIFNLLNGEETNAIEVDPQYPTLKIDASKDLFFQYSKQGINILRVSDGEFLSKIKPSRWEISGIGSVSPDGKWLAYEIGKDDEREICLCDLETLSPYTTIENQDAARVVKFLNSNRLLINDTVYDCATGHKVFSIPNDPIITGVTAATTEFIASAMTKSGIFGIYSIETGALLKTFRGHAHILTSLSFSESGEQIISCAQDHTIKFWNIQNETSLLTLKSVGGQSSVFSSPNSKIAVEYRRTGAGDKVRVLDFGGGRRVTQEYIDLRHRQWRQQVFDPQFAAELHVLDDIALMLEQSTNHEHRFTLAVANFRFNKIRSAINIFKHCLKQNPDDQEKSLCLAFLVMCHAKLGESDFAIVRRGELSDLLASDSALNDARMKQLLQETVGIKIAWQNKSDEEAWSRLNMLSAEMNGIAIFDQGKIVSSNDSVWRLPPSNAHVARVSANLFSDAVRSFDRVIKQYPESSRSFLYRGLANLRLGQRSRARSDLVRYVGFDSKLSPPSERLASAWLPPLGLAVLETELGRLKNALQQIRIADRQVSTSGSANEFDVEIGVAFLNVLYPEEGDKGEALVAAKNAIELKPESLIALEAIFVANWFAGNRDEATKAYKSISEQVSKHKRTSPEKLSIYRAHEGNFSLISALAEFHKGDTSRSRHEFGRAVRWYPDRTHFAGLQKEVAEYLLKECQAVLNLSGKLANVNFQNGWKPIIENRLDAEKTDVIVSSGRTFAQTNMLDFGPYWTNDGYRLWADVELNSVLSMKFNCKRSGTHQIFASLTGTAGFGICQFEVNGQRVGRTIDLSDSFKGTERGVTSLDEYALGKIELNQGENVLSIKVVGKSDHAIHSDAGFDHVDVWPEELWSEEWQPEMSVVLDNKQLLATQKFEAGDFEESRNLFEELQSTELDSRQSALVKLFLALIAKNSNDDNADALFEDAKSAMESDSLVLLDERLLSVASQFDNESIEKTGQAFVDDIMGRSQFTIELSRYPELVKQLSGSRMRPAKCKLTNADGVAMVTLTFIPNNENQWNTSGQNSPAGVARLLQVQANNGFFRASHDQITINGQLTWLGVFERKPNAMSGQEALGINNKTWEKVKSPPADPDTPMISNEELTEIRKLCEISPAGFRFNTLAAAEYRLGNYSEAIEAAKKSLELTPLEMNLPGQLPSDYAILAMSFHQLEDPEKAKTNLELFDKSMQIEAFKNDDENKSFASELSELLK